MDLTGTGIWDRDLRFAEDDGEVRDAAAELEALGFTALFVPGGAGGDWYGAVRRLLDATSTVTVATGIVNVWMHEPEDVARETSLAGDRLLLGLGISHAQMIDQGHPGRYARPVLTMRGYLDALDAATPPVAPERRVLAALGPKMLALAAERTRGAHPYFVPVEHTRLAREALGPGRLLAPEQAVLLETDPARARAAGRAHLAPYLEMPNYTNNLLRTGFTEADLAGGGSDRLVDAIVAWGDEAAIRARVDEHRAAGADHVCVQVVGGVPGELPRDTWRRLAPALVG